MELKQYQINVPNCFFRLLIVPCGIETEMLAVDDSAYAGLLIVPYGIEIVVYRSGNNANASF